jgi:hypothetical protein
MNTIKSKYASMGLGNSTMVADQQGYLDLQAESLRGQLAQQLAQTGMTLLSNATADLGMESQIYSELMQAQIQQDTALSSSISGFASSLAMASVLNKSTSADATS